MTAPSKHILHNILPILGLKCLNVRICDRDILPWHFSFAGWMLDLSRSCFDSDMTENTLYLHSTDFSLSLRTYPGFKRRQQKQRIFKSACWALRPLLWTTYDRDKSEIFSQQFWYNYIKYIPSPSVAAVRSTYCVLSILTRITKSYQFLRNA